MKKSPFIPVNPLKKLSSRVKIDDFSFLKELFRRKFVSLPQNTVNGIIMTTDLKTSTAAGLSPRVLQFQRGNPWYATDEEVDKLRQEYLAEKYK